MDRTQHPSNNRVLGAPKGWNQKELPCGALAVTQTEIDGQPVMVSFWRPDAVELAALNNGGLVSLWIYGAGHPPVFVGVTP